MDSQLTQLCKAIVVDLNAATFETALQFNRVWLPRYDLLTVAAGRQGWVLPSAERREPDSRSQWITEFDVQIGVVKKLADDDAADSDVEQRLIEQIADYYDQQRPTGIAMPLSAITCVPLSQDHLERYQIYLGAVLLTFQSWRD